ncbi:MAG: galactokinase family protein, partial [Verrucomicrobiia bacterium]
MIERLKERFKGNYEADPAVIAAAPGRVEVIGNHTDYNQGPVIGAAIDRGVVVALRRIDEAVFRFSSADSSVIEISDSSERQRGGA